MKFYCAKLQKKLAIALAIKLFLNENLLNIEPTKQLHLQHCLLLLYT